MQTYDLQSLVGRQTQELDTPELVVDLDRLEDNIARMAAFFGGRRARLRPHFKTHKCIEIARRQLAAGAIGITCAKLSEAEVLATAGIDSILIAGPIAGRSKIARLAALLSAGAARGRKFELLVAADDARNLTELGRAMETSRVVLGVVVELDVGLGRCGARSVQAAVNLGRKAAAALGLELRGLMGYEGHAVFIENADERTRVAGEALARLAEAASAFERAGLSTEIVSAGATGTYATTGAHPAVTEVQAGSYVLMDARYRAVVPEFEPALLVLSSVVSAPERGRAVVDAGLKTMTAEFGPPVPLAGGVRLERVNEEHGILALEPDAPPFAPGDRVAFLPTHACTTVNLHERLVAVRGDMIEAVWPVAARGCVR